MKPLVFATHNQDKLNEIQALFPISFQLISLHDIDIREEIPETASTLEGNAIQKVQYVYRRAGIPCFADDTGLEVEALNGEPGTYSARYAGMHASYTDNLKKLMLKMSSQTNRKARFKTVIAYTNGYVTKTFEGVIQGTIATAASGRNGFGYDPVFIPEGYSQSFAEMEAKLKNTISHRAIAFKEFILFLTS